jgi:hypothetical protein
MPWIRVDDNFDEHPKFAKAGPLGIALWLAGLAYCNRNLTDGFIPWATAQSLISWSFITSEEKGEKVWTCDVGSGQFGDNVTCPFVINLLLEAGLWDQVPGGYRVHDFHDYQPSKSQVLAEREHNKNRQASFRKRNAVTNGESNAANNGVVTVAPVPVPKEGAPSNLSPSSLFGISTNLPSIGPRKKSAPHAFQKPSMEDLRSYCLELGGKVDPEQFFAKYEANGWRVGKNPMKDWRAAVRYWATDPFGTGNRASAGPSPPPPREVVAQVQRERWEALEKSRPIVEATDEQVAAFRQVVVGPPRIGRSARRAPLAT